MELLCHDFKYLKNGMFSYLVIFTGVNAAQVFKSEPNARRCHWVGRLIDWNESRSPNHQPLYRGDPLAAGQGGIIGVIFAVWLLTKLETVLHRVIPEAIDIIVTPTLCLLAIGLAGIF